MEEEKRWSLKPGILITRGTVEKEIAKHVDHIARRSRQPHEPRQTHTLTFVWSPYSQKHGVQAMGEKVRDAVNDLQKKYSNVELSVWGSPSDRTQRTIEVRIREL